MADYAWTYWTSGTTFTSTITGADAWCAWNTSASTTSGSSTAWTYWTTASTVAYLAYQPVTLTPEQEEAQRVRDQERRDRQERAEQERIAARRKAQELLESCLTVEQVRTLREQRYFDVRSIRPDGEETVYRVRQGHAGNVDELDSDGTAVRRFCIHPVGVPDEDAMLAQKLMLETDPASFERIANVTRLRRAA